MIKNLKQKQFVKRTSLLVNDKKSIVQKVRSLVESSVEKRFVKASVASPKLDLFSDTLYNNSFYNYCKKEEKKRLTKKHRLIML